VTDLKAANQMLAQAIAALESAEHDADVSEAEAIRNRLLDLDAAIGARIQAKLDAHRLIIDQWGVSEVIVPRKLEDYAGIAAGTLTVGYGITVDEPIVVIEDPLAVFDADTCDAEPVPTADAWEAHREKHASEYSLTGDEVPDAVLMNGAAESVAEIQQEQ
jgi:hypothetical protein